MAETAVIDITSSAFAVRLANLLVATRKGRGQSRLALSMASHGRFGYADIRDHERARRTLDEATIDDLVQLYGCDLGTILPSRLPILVTEHEVSAGGVHQSYAGGEPDALLVAYLHVVRTLRRQRHTPVVDLRRDDLEILAEYLREPRESVLHRLATLMNATQRKRVAMTGVLASGAAVIGLVGVVAAVDGGPTPTSEISTPTTAAISSSDMAPTVSLVVTTVVATDAAPVPVTVAPTEPTVAPVVSVAPAPQTTPSTIKVVAIGGESNLTTSSANSPDVGVDEPPLP